MVLLHVLLLPKTMIDMTVRGDTLKIFAAITVLGVSGVLYGAENSVFSLSDFLRGNILGYSQYLSMDEFSDLQMIKDSAAYFEMTGDTSSREILIKQSASRCAEYKAKADFLFMERLASVRKKLSLLQKNLSSNNGEDIQIQQISADFAELEHLFASTRCIPYNSSVLRAIELQYSAIVAAQQYKNVYIVQEGDCFVNISEKLFGSYKYWQKLYEANKEILPVPQDPSLIYPGLIFMIP